MIQPFGGYCRAQLTRSQSSRHSPGRPPHTSGEQWRVVASVCSAKVTGFATRLLLAIATSNEASRQKAGILEVVTKKLSNY